MRSIRFLIGFLLILVLSTCTKFGKNITVKGRVLNPITGEGIAGMEVWLQKTTLGLPGGNKTIKSVTTDADGNFELDKLTVSSPVILVNSHGLYHEIGWWTGSSYSSFLKLPVKKGKKMNVDYHLVPYGNLKYTIKNISCFNQADTLVLNIKYQIPNISDNSTIYTGCFEYIGAVYSKFPMGLYYFDGYYKKNNVVTTFSDSIYITEGGYHEWVFEY